MGTTFTSDMFSASASPPRPFDQKLCAWTQLGALLPRPHYKLAISAVHQPVAITRKV